MATVGVQLPPRLENLFKFTERNFTPEETQRVFEHSNKILGNAPQGSMYGWLRLLHKQGQITKNNVVLLKDYLAKHSSNGREIEREVNHYISELPEERPVLIGRDGEVEKITTKLRTDESAVINMYGTSGVGKTTLAKEICYRWDKESMGRSLTVDLREVKEMKFVYFRILQALEPNKTSLIYEEEAVLKRVRQLTEREEPVLVLLDNIEQFAGGGDQKIKTEFLSFLERLKSSNVDKFKKLRILLTGREQLTVKLIEDVHLRSLEEDEAAELLETGNPAIAVELMIKMLELCRGRPLLLNTVAAALRQERVNPEQLICKIEKEVAAITRKSVKTVLPKETKKPKLEESVPESTARKELEAELLQDSSFLRPMFFNLPSKELQDAAASLSLFCHPFSLKASAHVLNVEMDKASLLLESLRSFNFITTGDPTANELTYDIHPLLKAFVNCIRNEANFKQAFQDAETRFSNWFMDKATSLAKRLDGDYANVFRMFKEESANYELALDITTTQTFIPESWNHDNAMLAILCDSMLNVGTRKNLFRCWADIAEKEKKGTFYCRVPLLLKSQLSID